MKAMHLAAVIAVPLALAACAAPQRSSGNDLVDALAALRADPGKRLSAEVVCERTFSKGVGDYPFQAFSAGLLNVPEPSGNRAFCAALVEAVIADDLTAEDIAVFQRPKEVRGQAPTGKLLRVVLATNERLEAQQAQRPPQAQSCGCGQ